MLGQVAESVLIHQIKLSHEKWCAASALGAEGTGGGSRSRGDPPTNHLTMPFRSF